MAKRVSPMGPYLYHAALERDRVRSFEEHPFNLPAIRTLDRLEFHPRVTFLIGENGSGKSTLLESVAVACRLNPEGGSPNFRFESRPEDYPLSGCLRLSKNPIVPNDSFFLRAETFYNVATEIERLGVGHAYGPRGLHHQSHGEAFLSLFEHRFRGRGLYLLDEPEAALSPTRQMSFLVLMKHLTDAGSQFVIATHSPIVMAFPDSWIYVLGESGPTRVAYEDTEHFRVWSVFMTNHAKILANLFAADQ